MGLIQRYLVGELLAIFGATLAGSVLMLTFGGGVKEGMRHGLPPQLVLELLPFLVIEMLRLTVPGCLLFATCSVFGRLVANNELRALKSVGINPLKVIWPALAVAYLLSLATFELYDISARWARPNLRRVLVESVAEVAYGVLKTDRAFSSDGISIVVEDVRQRKLVRPVVQVAGRGDNPPMTLTAQEAELRYNEEAGTLQMICFETGVEVVGKWSMYFPDRFVHDITLPGQTEQADHHKSPANLPQSSIGVQIDYEYEQLEQLRGQPPEVPRDEMMQKWKHHELRLYRLQAEVQRRLANGFACFCFALVGIPVAMWWQSSDNVSAFFACFLPILLVYYPLLVVGETIARKGTTPELSVWLANAVLVAVGLFAMRHVLRH